MLRPRTMITVTSSVICAGLIGALMVVAYHNGMAEDFPIPFASFASPVILLLGGSYFLLRGSRIARALLGMLFATSILSFAGIVAFLVLATDVPWDALQTQTLWSCYLLFPGWLLLFSRGLGNELAQIREERSLGKQAAPAHLLLMVRAE